jgi:hypothetical protein
MTSDIELRLARLERRNRWMGIGLMAMAVLAAVGWRQAGPERVQVRRLEVVDDRGVPLVTIGAERGAVGGAITLRAANGERRLWLSATNDGAAIAMSREGADDGGDTCAGLSVGTDRARLSLLGSGGASLSAAVESDRPKVELFDKKGASLFVAPWGP